MRPLQRWSPVIHGPGPHFPGYGHTRSVGTHEVIRTRFDQIRTPSVHLLFYQFLLVEVGSHHSPPPKGLVFQLSTTVLGMPMRSFGTPSWGQLDWTCLVAEAVLQLHHAIEPAHVDLLEKQVGRWAGWSRLVGPRSKRCHTALVCTCWILLVLSTHLKKNTNWSVGSISSGTG